jgi:hypothetical protein
MGQDQGVMRAQRFGVNWPMRVRPLGSDEWHDCRTLNLSVSGVLLRTYGRDLDMGARVEVEIHFPPLARRSIVSGVGHVVRHESSIPGGVAVHFLSSPLSES